MSYATWFYCLFILHLTTAIHIRSTDSNVIKWTQTWEDKTNERCCRGAYDAVKSRKLLESFRRTRSSSIIRIIQIRWKTCLSVSVTSILPQFTVSHKLFRIIRKFWECTAKWPLKRVPNQQSNVSWLSCYEMTGSFISSKRIGGEAYPP